MAYGEYRSTIDVDLVADVRLVHLKPLLAAFPEPDFYLSDVAMREALAAFSQFNLIHVPTGLKVDFMIPEVTTFNASRFARVRAVALSPQLSVPVASPEDITLMKLRYFHAGASDKHLRDIAGMLRILGASMDRAYIERWAQEFGVEAEWKLVRDSAE